MISWDEIEDETKFNIYRILQEALHNINKYAQAKNVRINFNIQDNMLILMVTDDGVGFDKKNIKKGIGITNMNSRAERLGGGFCIESLKGQGTVLTTSIPV